MGKSFVSDQRAGVNSDQPPAEVIKFSVIISRDVGERARRLTFEERLSESSLFEVALRLLFDSRTDKQVADLLRQHGATLRRRSAPRSTPA